MTSTDSTSRPSSQTARTNRSTRTVVLPVPAPAETKTSPRASTAARCSALSAAVVMSCPLDPAHPPEVAPGRARPALRIVANVARPDPFGGSTGALARAVDDAPERVFVEVVGLRELRQVIPGLGAQKAP